MRTAKISEILLLLIKKIIILINNKKKEREAVHNKGTELCLIS